MSLTTSKTYQRLPAYLRSYVVEQDYGRYTSREQATWRYIMRQAREFLRDHAHDVYLEGLAKTGIPISRIPNIEEMDTILSRFGWGAVCVRGFIPPLAFLDFQARRVLPIAADMRSLEHLAYTSAPDIVHEAAGHAPILADKDYSDYLTRYAQLARKAIYSQEDISLYEAIRALSDIKESPDATPQEIARAETRLTAAVAELSWVSEASQVGRMNWWTVEYGLIGSLEAPKIYGAGLLSSLSESRNCLTAAVEKRPLSLQCIEQSYDITRPQPQLYVASSFAELTAVLSELEETMAFKRGGLAGLKLAQRAGTVTTTELDSGLAVTGILVACEQEGGQVSFLRWQGPVQLSFGQRQLAGHGRERHGSGFSTPLGTWAAYAQRHPSTLTPADLAAIGLRPGHAGRLEFSSGFVVSGILIGHHYHNGAPLFLSWKDCTVTRGDKVYFEPAWGEFDMAIGVESPSVYGGPADWEAYGAYDLGRASSSPGRSSPFTADERQLFELYTEVRRLREACLKGRKGEGVMAALAMIAATAARDYGEEWLLALELAEVCQQAGGCKWQEVAWGQNLLAGPLNQTRYPAPIPQYIAWGLALLGIAD